MPYKVRKTDDKFKVVNIETSKVKGTHSTKAKARIQVNLLRGVEHGWKPTGKPARKK